MIKVSSIGFLFGAVAYIGFLFGCTYVYNRVESIQSPCNVKIYTETISPSKEDKHDDIDLSMWITIVYDNRSFYFTDSSNPNHFSEQMTYIWNEIGCYAFRPEEFNFDEIYELVMSKPHHKQIPDFEKFGSVIENI
jgi:CMP-2-keto-3-deoxyoctulosonic acid synthetase